MTQSTIFITAAAAALVTACGDSSAGSGPEFDLSCVVPSAEVFDGGVARDGIPALTNPEITTATQGSFLGDTDRVLGLVVNGAARAYPFTVMWWHEVVNDTLGGESVLVTYCPLTGSGIAFDPRVDGRVRNFGVSGLLYRTNLIMFDRDTESLWNQMLLSGMCGLERGKELARLPIVETTWGHWRTLHPNTTVMTENTGFADRPYGLYPYGNYDEPHNTDIGFLSTSTRMRINDVRPPKELALGIFNGSVAVAYTFGVLSDQGTAVAVSDTVASTPVLVTYFAPQETAMAFDRRVNGAELTFTVATEAPMTLMDRETGTVWDATGKAVTGPLAGEATHTPHRRVRGVLVRLVDLLCGYRALPRSVTGKDCAAPITDGRPFPVSLLRPR